MSAYLDDESEHFVAKVDPGQKPRSVPEHHLPHWVGKPGIAGQHQELALEPVVKSTRGQPADDVLQECRPSPSQLEPSLVQFQQCCRPEAQRAVDSIFELTLTGARREVDHRAGTRRDAEQSGDARIGWEDSRTPMQRESMYRPSP